MSKRKLMTGDVFVYKPDGATYRVGKINHKVQLIYHDGSFDTYSYSTIMDLTENNEWIYKPVSNLPEELFSV